MEDQKKSIVYLLQGLAGSIRNKMNWQVQGSLHITLKSFEKAVCTNTHLILDLNTTLILFWIGFTTTTPPLTMSIQILFFLLLLFYL